MIESVIEGAAKVAEKTPRLAEGLMKGAREIGRPINEAARRMSERIPKGDGLDQIANRLLGEKMGLNKMQPPSFLTGGDEEEKRRRQGNVIVVDNSVHIGGLINTG